MANGWSTRNNTIPPSKGVTGSATGTAGATPAAKPAPKNTLNLSPVDKARRRALDQLAKATDEALAALKHKGPIHVTLAEHLTAPLGVGTTNQREQYGKSPLNISSQHGRYDELLKALAERKISVADVRLCHKVHDTEALQSKHHPCMALDRSLGFPLCLSKDPTSCVHGLQGYTGGSCPFFPLFLFCPIMAQHRMADEKDKHLYPPCTLAHYVVIDYNRHKLVQGSTRVLFRHPAYVHLEAIPGTQALALQALHKRKEDHKKWAENKSGATNTPSQAGPQATPAADKKEEDATGRQKRARDNGENTPATQANGTFVSAFATGQNSGFNKASEIDVDLDMDDFLGDIQIIDDAKQTTEPPTAGGAAAKPPAESDVKCPGCGITVPKAKWVNHRMYECKSRVKDMEEFQDERDLHDLDIGDFEFMFDYQERLEADLERRVNAAETEEREAMELQVRLADLNEALMSLSKHRMLTTQAKEGALKQAGGDPEAAAVIIINKMGARLYPYEERLDDLKIAIGPELASQLSDDELMEALQDTEGIPRDAAKAVINPKTATYTRDGQPVYGIITSGDAPIRGTLELCDFSIAAQLDRVLGENRHSDGHAAVISRAINILEGED